MPSLTPGEIAYQQYLQMMAANQSPTVAQGGQGNFPPPTQTTPPGYGTGPNQGQPAMSPFIPPIAHAAGQQAGNILFGPSVPEGPSMLPPATPSGFGATTVGPDAWSSVSASGGVGNGTAAGITGAANVTQSPWALSGIGSAGNAYLPIAGAVGAVDVLSHGNQYSPTHSALEGAASGAALGSYFGPWGAGIGAGVGALGGLLASQFGHGKNYYDANKRGKLIGELTQSGFLQPDAGQSMMTPGGRAFPSGSVELDDGSRYSIGGADEKATHQGVGGNTLHAYDVDFGKANIGNVVAAINPIAAYLAKGDPKLTSDLAGYLVNAATSKGNVEDNVKHFYGSLGMGHDQIYGAIHLMAQNGQLDQETADAYKNGLDQLYGVGAYAKGGKPNPSPQPTGGAQPVTQAVMNPQPRPNQPIVPRDVMPPRGATPPNGNAGGAQMPTPRGNFTPTRSPFIASPMNGRQRLSPGIWQDSKGQYLSKTGTRGQ